MNQYPLILAICSSIASNVEIACFLLLDFPKPYLSPTLIKIIGAFMFLTHALFVVILYRRRSTNPERALGWRKTAVFDIILMLVGVGFHYVLDSKVRSLVLATSMTFDAMVLSLLLYPIEDIGLLDAANGVLLEVAINLYKVSGGYVLPSFLLLCVALILWRALANSRDERGGNDTFIYQLL